MKFSLNGKTAVITGGGSGIGKAISETFAEMGATVHILDMNVEAGTQTASDISSKHKEAFFYPCDVSKYEEVAKIMQEANGVKNGIDILINNAGIGFVGNIENTTEEDLDRLYNVNVKGPLFTVNEATTSLNEGASVIFNTSVSNVKGFPAMAAYAFSKAALRSITKTLAVEFGGRGIRVNSLSPGPIDTPIYGKHNVDQESVNAMAGSFPSMVPLGRFGEAKEIASVALFLASSDSSYITGAEIPVDGGFAQV